MKKKSSEGKGELPKGFTRGMAVMDFLPVLFFSLSAGILAGRLQDPVFLTGTVLVIAAGCMKAGWKLLIAFAKKNIPFLTRQMRFLMPVGFILMIVGLITGRTNWSIGEVIRHIISLPSLVFFLAGIAGLGCMIYFAGHLDSMDARSNWIEQGTNAAAQLCILLGIWL